MQVVMQIIENLHKGNSLWGTKVLKKCFYFPQPVSVHHVARGQSTSSPITILLPPDIMLKSSCFQSGQDKYEKGKKKKKVLKQ